MARGRKPKSDKPVKWNISIPSSLAVRVELLMLDPFTRQPRYGGRSELISLLLNEWVKQETYITERRSTEVPKGKQP